MPRIRDYLCQERNQDATIEASVAALSQLLATP
jgi:hypothetical protein